MLESHGITVDQMVADFVRTHQLPGITMAIVQAPYIPRSAGYGVINVHNDELASTKTMWNIGPITQGFTAVAVLQLKEQGRLSINDPISKYLSDIPGAWGKITILQLLQHASGLPDFREAGKPMSRRKKRGGSVFTGWQHVTRFSPPILIPKDIDNGETEGFRRLGLA